MIASYNKGKLIARLLLYAFLLLLTLMLIHGYQVIRNERVSTRFSVRLAEGQHEIVASLPSGHFQIQFTPKANVSPPISVPPEPVLTAHVSTSILRQDGSTIVQPTQKEYLTFHIADRDAFRPLHLLVNIAKTNECTVYMNLASGF